jgi:hypothetical protein
MSKIELNTPILLMIYNRPDLTEQIFNKIKESKPSMLFIAADGPKANNLKDEDLCNQTRNVTEQIDWNCQVFRLYRPFNLGCKVAVSESINWFFGHVEEGIILEDDCLPHTDFFRFCSEMLEKYRHDNTIGHVTGTNFFPDAPGVLHSHRISKYPYIWGWATWKRVWENYKLFPLITESFQWNLPQATFIEKLNLLRNLTKIHANKLNTWDYQYMYLLWKHSQSSVIPSQNLISNIGFDHRATHTKDSNSAMTISSSPLEIYKHKKNPIHISLEEKVYDQKAGAHLLGTSFFGILIKFLKHYPLDKLSEFVHKFKKVSHLFKTNPKTPVISA